MPQETPSEFTIRALQVLMGAACKDGNFELVSKISTRIINLKRAQYHRQMTRKSLASIKLLTGGR